MSVRTLPSGEPRPRYDQERLLLVAVDVFTERGYDGTSMDQLSHASGLSKSSLYHHIDGKEHLLRMALERALDPLLAVLEEPEATTGRAIDRLHHVITREVQVLTECLPFVTLLLRVRGNTETERWALDRRREFDHRVTTLVEEAVVEGDIRADVDAATTTRLVFGLVNSLIEWYRPDGGLTPDDLAAQITSLIFTGLHTTPSGAA